MHMDTETSGHVNTVPQPIPEREPTVAVSVAAPESVWKRVRSLSGDRRVSAQTIWLEAIAEYLERRSEAA